jgi:zinc transporter ZupT
MRTGSLAALGALYGVAVFGAAPVTTRIGLLAAGAVMMIAVLFMFSPGAGSWPVQQRLARCGGYGYE